jgi:hypothetical protein
MKTVRRALILCAPVVLLSGCATDTIEDRRYGQQIICHDGEKTLTLSNADGYGHLQHGDSVGPCPAKD